MQTGSTHSEWIQEHADFLRRLARRLVRDEHDCEDLLQETWASACSVPPRAAERPRSLRAWLARTVRNRAANLRRERARREQREQGAARRESFDPSSVHDELGVQEAVVAAVRGLREPYRTAIYLRYYRDLQPAVIADELGVPVATVNTQLLRGRALLRETLTRELGGRRAWLAALLPLSGWPRIPGVPPAAPPAGSILTIGVAGMKLKLALGAAAAVAAVLTYSWTRDVEPEREGTPRASSVAASDPASAVTSAAVEVEGEPLTSEPVPRVAVPSPAAAAPAPPSAVEPAAAGIEVGGVVLDLEGRPLPATRVAYKGAGAARGAVTDSAGRFLLEIEAGPGRVVTAEPELITVIEGVVDGDGRDSETAVVAAPACGLLVTVTDEGGVPLAGARVEVVLPPDFRGRFASGLESSAEADFEGLTNLAGQFDAAVPAVPGATLAVARDDYESASRELDAALLTPAGRSALTIALRHLAQRAETVAGVVLDDQQRGLPGALVELGHLSTRSDSEGEFHFDLSGDDPFVNWMGGARLPAVVVAVRPGSLPATLEVPRDADGREQWPDLLVLEISEPALSIAGRVVDEHGAPLADAVVFLPRAHLIAGGTTLEAAIRGDTDFFLSVRTDGAGRFEFGGLLRRDYDIAAFQEGTLLRGDARDVPAGASDIELRIDTTALWSEVHGRVLSRDGWPLENVLVTPAMVTQRAEGSTGSWRTSAKLTPVTTDAEGRFVLHDLPRANVGVNLDHPELMVVEGLELRTPGASEEEPGILRGVVLEAALRLRFQIQLDDPTEADSFEVQDANGTPTWPFAQTANRYYFTDSHLLLTDGRSTHLFVDENATTIVLRKEGEEVRRIPLALEWLAETILR